MNCLICGREIPAGRYCDSCRFYEVNAQCWRCRMYLPKVELQQWRGQTYCPYCIMEIREAEVQGEEQRGAGARAGEAPPDASIPPEERPFGQGQKNPDYECDKCKGDLDIAYVVADHKFCEICFQQQIREIRSEGGRQPPYLKYKIKEGPGLFIRFLRYMKAKISEEWKKRTKKK